MNPYQRIYDLLSEEKPVSPFWAKVRHAAMGPTGEGPKPNPNLGRPKDPKLKKKEIKAGRRPS